MRLQNWQELFEDFCKERRTMPFAWGVNDCALFAADCVLAIAGVDHGGKFRGYKTARQAHRLIAMSGGLTKIVTVALGEPLRSAYATVGDVVLVEMNGTDSLGISNGSVCFGPGLLGMVVLNNSAVKQIWKI